MKRKIIAIILCTLLIVGTMGGCASGNSTSTDNSTTNEVSDREMSAKNTGTTDTAAIAEAAAIEIDSLNLVTSWEQKAVITLESSITIEGSGAKTSDSMVVISEGGAYEISGTLEAGMIYVETDEAVKLILNGVNITNPNGPAIYVYDAEVTYIELAEGTENVLTDGTDYSEDYAKENADGEMELGKATIFANDDLVFVGTGSLTVIGNYKHAICSDDMIYFESGSLTLSAVKDGVHVNDGICVDGGMIEVLTANDAMESEGAFVMNGGELILTASDDGVSVLGNLTVNDGTINISTCEEGLEAKNNLVINGGNIEIIGNDDGLNGGNLVQINGGFLYSNISNGDAIDSNGTLEINGGLVIALGGGEPEGGADCDQNEFIITGGTLIATGGTNSSPTESSCTQAAILLGSTSAGDEIAVKDSAGNVVFAFKVSKAYSNLLLTTGSIKSGESYTVYTGGTITGTDETYGYYESAQYEGGSESVSFTVDGMIVSAGGSVGMQGGGMRGGNSRDLQKGEKPTMSDESGGI